MPRRTNCGWNPCLSYDITLFDSADIGRAAVLAVIAVITDHEILIFLKCDFAFQKSRFRDPVNKSDLADAKKNKLWMEYFAKKGFHVLEINAKTGSGGLESLCHIFLPGPPDTLRAEN